jgi:coenzyme F420-reducing hydrogenase gamma subunit
MPTKPRLAVFKFASCDGCQLSLLDCEDDLLSIAERVEIAYFLEVGTQDDSDAYDIGLVEGSITTSHDAERIRAVRAQCRYLVTIGACATAGGIQALRNWGDVNEFAARVYAKPQYIQALATSTPIADHVKVDFELRGCPINKHQLIELISALLWGRTPRVPRQSLCIECKRRQVVCVAVAKGVACLGPVTQIGCEVVCPSYDRECFGCFGPKEHANVISLGLRYRAEGHPQAHLTRLVRSFNAGAPEFRNADDLFGKHDNHHDNREG